MLGEGEPERQYADEEEAGQYEAGENEAGGEEGAELRSLAEDIHALIDDSKTYAQAELAFQKSRIGYVSNRGKSGVGYALAALGFLHLALIALVVGGIMTLAPIIGAGLATLAIVGLLGAGVLVAALLAKRRFSSISEAFESDD